jgi:hypothetical protein
VVGGIFIKFGGNERIGLNQPRRLTDEVTRIASNFVTGLGSLCCPEFVINPFELRRNT